MTDHIAKLAFLNWMIRHYPHPNPEIMAFLNFLIHQPHLLNWLEFSQDVIYAPRGIKISYLDPREADLTYYKGEYFYYHAEQAFHDFRLNPRKDALSFYLEFEGVDMVEEALRQGVLIDNPYRPLELRKLDQVDQETHRLSQQAFQEFIKKEMDRALDQEDYVRLDILRAKYLQKRGKSDAN